MVIMANPKAGISSVADLEAAARKTGRLDFGSGGPGSIGHIHGELMKKQMNINLQHVPYRGAASSLPARSCGVRMLLVAGTAMVRC